MDAAASRLAQPAVVPGEAMHPALAPALCSCALLAGLSLAIPAHAAALYFEKAVVKTSSEATCLKFAGDVARNQAFKNVHKSNAEVAGEKDGAYVAITCVGRGGQPAIAVVMSTAGDFGVAKQVGHEVAGRIKGIICFDSPC
jgi:hypothetical protein